MKKTILVELPIHVKKFFMAEYHGYTNKHGRSEIDVKKSSEIGSLIDAVSRPILHNQPILKPEGDGVLAITYYCHILSHDVANDKLPKIAKAMDHIFRRSMICYVSSIHEIVGGDYGPYVSQFLANYGIEREIDVDYQTMRKIYRDQIDRKNRKTAKSCA